jgi:Na+/H+ antiporter NhaC
MINEVLIHIIFQLILSTIVFWMFMSKELTINVNRAVKDEMDRQYETLAADNNNKDIPLNTFKDFINENDDIIKYIPREDAQALKSNYNLLKYHIVIVLILLPICFIILFLRDGQYMSEVLILVLVYSIVLPVNVIFTLTVAPNTHFDGRTSLRNAIIDYANKKCDNQ